MQIVISGRHTNLSQRDQEMIREKMSKYERKLSNLTKIELVVNIENDRHDVEGILHVAHSNPLVAHASAHNNQGALDQVVSKLDNLVSKFTGKQQNHKSH